MSRKLKLVPFGPVETLYSIELKLHSALFDCKSRIKNKLFSVGKKQDYIFTGKLNVSRVIPCR